MTSATGHSNARRRWEQGFTLIELILVLTLLAISAALIAPALSDFIRGRALDSEALRLLSVSRAAQSRAVSEGLPVLLWLDAPNGAYGTEEETKAGAADSKALSFTVNDSVRLSLADSGHAATTQLRHSPAIRFLPDGNVDEASPTTIRLTDSTGAVLRFVQSRTRMGYEIQR
jgi:type II secretion system protein H